MVSSREAATTAARWRSRCPVPPPSASAKQGISFLLSFPTSPTRFQGRILKPIYSGFLALISPPLKCLFLLKEDCKEGWSEVFPAAQQVSGFVTFDTAWSLYYCWRPGVQPALQQPLKLSAIRNWWHSSNPWQKHTKTLERFQYVMCFPELIFVMCPIPSSLLHIIHSGITTALTGK